jgi:hypothetical protein
MADLGAGELITIIIKLILKKRGVCLWIRFILLGMELRVGLS